MVCLAAAAAVAVDVAVSAPAAKISENATDVEAALELFLDAYYDRYWKKRLEVEEDGGPAKNGVGDGSEEDIYETMQGDQPVENNVGLASMPYELNSTVLLAYRSNSTEQLQYREATRNR